MRPSRAQVSCARVAGDTSAKIGHQAVTRHVGADEGRIVAAAFGELAVAVALAGLGPFGLGVAEQHKTAHCGNVAFLRLQV